MKRVVARLAVGLAVLGSFGVFASSALAASPDVVISQVYGGGGNAGATYTNDFIELYNRGSATVSLSGWSVQYASATGATWQVTNLTGSIAAGAHYLVQEGAGAGGTTALPTPDATGNIAMSATAGKVALATSSTALAGCPTGVRDLVGYGATANCVEGSAAPGLSNTTADLRASDGTDTDNNAADFTAGAPNPRNAGSTPPPPPPSMKIDEIQGSGQFSPVVGQKIQTTGIVTERRTVGGTRGYFIEDPNWDSDPSTSEGIFVFMGSTTPTVQVGDSVSVIGTVSEFISSGSGDLPETELTGPTTTLISTGNTMPMPVVIGAGGLTPPTQSVPDGIAFNEALEGMLVELDDIQTVSATNSFGEVWVVPNNGAGAGPLSNRGGIVLQQNDQNPEKFLLDDDAQPSGVNMPVVDVDAHAPGPQVGVMDYGFDNYTIHLLQLPTFTPSTIDRETTSVADSSSKLTVATFNVENLAPSDPDSKFAGLANVLVHNLGAPDIVALEEVQDNSGATDNDGVVDSTDTLNKLAAAVTAAGGPPYAYAWVNPVADQDGGQPGGNIRVVFFYRTDVPNLSLAPGTAGGSTDANAVVGTGADTHLLYNPGRIDPASPAWTASRKPLAGEFTFNGHNVFLVANHFVSKLGDDPMWGLNQPPVNASETQRHQQANEDASFVSSLLSADPGANVVLLGDLNDFQFSDTVSILEGSGVHDLIKDLPVAEQYTYVFDGNSQAIDHILVGGGLSSAPRDYDVVHVNSEFATQTSDHEPQIVSFELPAATVSAGGPYTVPEGGSVTLHATGNGTINWDLDNNGTYETAGPDATFSAATIDGPATSTVGVQLTTADGATATDTAQVTVTNVAPTATFHSPSSATVGSSFTISLSDPVDPASADTFTYAFDCGDGFGAYGTATSKTCVANTPGAQQVAARIKDDDGGVTTYNATVTVDVTAAGLCRLTVQYVESSARYQKLPAIAKKITDALAQAACDKLDRLPTAQAPRAAAVNAYIAAVNGLRSAGWLTADQAATLTALAKAL